MGRLSVLALLFSCASALTHAAPTISGITMIPRLTVQSDVGITNQIEYSTDLAPSNWTVLTNLLVTESPYWFADVGAPPASHRFYRVVTIAQTNLPPAPTNMVLIPRGSFTMGSPDTEMLREPDETQHAVILTQPIYMGKYPVTQGEYLAVVGSNPSYFKTNSNGSINLNRPVETVTWVNATNYCALLTQAERTAGRIPTNWVFRLPTEAEWEYACRAGTTTAFHFGNAIHAGMASFYVHYEYDATSGEIYVENPAVQELVRPTPVGSYAPNAFGLYDMHGNIWEWCQDRYGAYPVESVVNPTGPASGASRVIRGGSFVNDGSRCRAAVREKSSPSSPSSTTGFRVVFAPIVP